MGVEWEKALNAKLIGPVAAAVVAVCVFAVCVVAAVFFRFEVVPLGPGTAYKIDRLTGRVFWLHTNKSEIVLLGLDDFFGQGGSR